MRRPFGLAMVVPTLVVTGVCLTAGAAVVLALLFGRAALLRQERDRLSHLSEAYATSVRFYLEGARSIIETTASLPSVRDALAAAAGPGTGARDVAAIETARRRAWLITQHSTVFDEVMLLGADGAVVLLEPRGRESVQVRPDRGYTAWYRDVMRAGETVVSDLHLSASTLEPAVVVASPVRDAAGQVVGVWGGALRLVELSRVGRAAEPTGASRGFVTDRRGLVVAHQTAPHYVEYQTDFGATPAVRAALTGERGAGRFEDPIERESRLGAWMPLAETGWAVVYEEPVAIAVAPIRALAWNIVPAAIAIAALVGAAGLFLARRIVRPIERLTVAAERVATDVPRFDVETTAIAEVGRLAGALDGMVAAIAERDMALRQRAAELERLVQALEAASRAKDQFLATLSHELRTPLNAVSGWARMLRAGPLDAATTARALEAIERNAAAQTQLIGDLLDVSRIVTGKMRLDVRTVSLDDVIRAALDTVGLAAEAKGVRLQPVLDPRAGPVKGDPERLQQVVWNLLVNAVKFTPRGGRVHVSLQRTNSHVEVVVSDTGQGIPADVLPHVFERFRQADSGTTRPHGGLGIGLALVRHLVELHGGSVHASSEGEGKGATFVVKLPVVSVDLRPSVSERVHSKIWTDGAVALDGVDVLVVDDDVDSLDLIRAILAERGAVVRTCASAATALGEFERARPDVLLGDIEMPGGDGYSLIRAIRTLPPDRGGNVPAAAVTAYGRTEDRVRALSAGFTTHLPKPVDPDELAAVVLSLARQGR